MWHLFKRNFKLEISNVDKLNKELHNIEFEYECGMVTSSSGDKIDFVRVNDVKNGYGT